MDETPTPASATPPDLPPRGRPRLGRLRFLLWGIALALGFGIGAVLSLTKGSDKKANPSGYTTWKAGERPAPEISLPDEHGTPFTLTGLRGRPVIVTFLDPFCRDFCPREARLLMDAVREVAPGEAAIVAISVNPPADTAANFKADAAHWKLGPEWRWGVGTEKQLADVWRRYQVGVSSTTQTIAGVKIRKVVHSGAAYIIDANGDERALFLWPFQQDDVVQALRDVTG